MSFYCLCEAQSGNAKNDGQAANAPNRYCAVGVDEEA